MRAIASTALAAAPQVVRVGVETAVRGLRRAMNAPAWAGVSGHGTNTAGPCSASAPPGRIVMHRVRTARRRPRRRAPPRPRAICCTSTFGDAGTGADGRVEHLRGGHLHVGRVAQPEPNAAELGLVRDLGRQRLHRDREADRARPRRPPGTASRPCVPSDARTPYSRRMLAPVSSSIGPAWPASSAQRLRAVRVRGRLVDGRALPRTLELDQRPDRAGRGVVPLQERQAVSLA